MERKITAKKSIVVISILLLIATVIAIVTVFAAPEKANAETCPSEQNINTQTTIFEYENDTVIQTVSTTQIENGVEYEFRLESKARGLFCVIAVSIQGDRNGTVTGIAKNKFTLGTSTIPVEVMLWSANIKSDVSMDVDPEAYNYTSDLNIFDTVECSAKTGGVGKYWMAAARWNFDNEGWETGVTPVSYYDKNAVYDSSK